MLEIKQRKIRVWKGRLPDKLQLVELAAYANQTKLFSMNCNTHTHTHGPFSGTIQVSWYQKGKTSLDFTEARDSEWQWHQLGHMQVGTSI